jgi:hypothetical protein
LPLCQAEVSAALIPLIETRLGQVEKVHQLLKRDDNVLRHFVALRLAFHAKLFS